MDMGLHRVGSGAIIRNSNHRSLLDVGHPRVQFLEGGLEPFLAFRTKSIDLKLMPSDLVAASMLELG